MRRLVSLATLAAILLAHAASADQAADARRATVLAHVGSKTITVGEAEDRLAQVPPYQLATFGDTPEKRTKKFVDEVMVPDLLYSLGAESRHLDATLPTSYALAHARADAASRAIKKSVPAAGQIPADDVRKYYEENRARYDTPERYNVWRILCGSRAEAETVLAEAKKDATVSNWNALARDHSMDRATYLRGGNLGFLAMDGTSNEVGVTVDKAIPDAASKVKDGEFVPQPVAEGANFAVVWRRGTVGANRRSQQEVDAQIRDTLWKQRGDAEVKRQAAELRTKHLTDFSPGLLDTLEITIGDGQIVPRKRPGQVAPVGSN